MLAADHRTSLARMLNLKNPHAVSSSKLFEIKRDIAKALSPFASATLLDYASFLQCKKARALAPNSSRNAMTLSCSSTRPK